MRPVLLLVLSTALLTTIAASPASAQTQPGGAQGGVGGTGGLGGLGGLGVKPDPDYDFRGPLAVISGVVVGAPLGLVAGWVGTGLTGPDDAADFYATLHLSWAGALIGDGLGVGIMCLTAWATDPEDLGHLPFLVVPPALATLGGLLVPLAFGGEGAASPVVVAPWSDGQGAGMVAAGRF